jgi:hypothetical protein
MSSQGPKKRKEIQMNTTEDIELHELEIIEHRLDAEASLEAESVGFVAPSASGFLAPSGSGFLIP